jgi:hypothetical protein
VTGHGSVVDRATLGGISVAIELFRS